MYRHKREMQFAEIARWTQTGNVIEFENVRFKILAEIFSLLEVRRDDLMKNHADNPLHIPEDDHLAIAWTLIVENGPLLAELIVRYPDMTEAITSNAQRIETANWIFRFALATLYPDDNDKKLIDYAKIELGLKPRPSGHQNPFSIEAQKQAKEVVVRELKRKQKLEKRLRAKGPKLSQRSEL